MRSLQTRISHSPKASHAVVLRRCTALRAKQVPSRQCSVNARPPKPPAIRPAIPIGDPREGQAVDVMGYLTRQRIVFIGTRITDDVATNVVAQLLALEAINPDEEIRMYINSGGGIPYAVNAILDTMATIKCPITTVALGACLSQSTLILAAGTPGRRYSMPNARIMMHQPQGGVQGSTHEVSIQAAELNRTMRVIQAMFQKYTGLPLETIEEETDRDTFMSAQRAKEMNLIDGIIGAV